MPKLRNILLAGLAFVLSGCKMALLDPKGLIAASEKALLIDATLLMLIIVIPVMLLTVAIVWRYRIKNTKAEYKPNWGHSNVIEAICWGAPLVIILLLAILTWTSTHKLDPYKPIVMKGKQPITIQVDALDWRWLFIYPKQGIATINFIQIPVDTPINLQITSNGPMNSIAIPRLAGQIYAMAAMRTKLHIVANHKGVYKGFSANYSGDGFASMKFRVKASSVKDFNRWVSQVKRSPHELTVSKYRDLVAPSTNGKVQYFSTVPKNLFNDIIMAFMNPKMHLLVTPKPGAATYDDELH